VSRPGGKTRDEAVSEAVRCVESVRETSLEAVESTIVTAEAIACAAMKQNLSENQLNDLQTHADKIVTLAGTFNLQPLESVAKSLCDLIACMACNGSFDAEAIAVHVQAMRLASPRNATLSSTEAKEVLTGLSKVLARWNCKTAPYVRGPKEARSGVLPDAK
jgi:hypothetical protein